MADTAAHITKNLTGHAGQLRQLAVATSNHARRLHSLNAEVVAGGINSEAVAATAANPEVLTKNAELASTLALTAESLAVNAEALAANAEATPEAIDEVVSKATNEEAAGHADLLSVAAANAESLAHNAETAAHHALNSETAVRSPFSWFLKRLF